jgi:DNA-binding transcriptional LysR family regulator
MRCWSAGRLPVALFDRACWWRDLAQDVLRKSGRAYRLVYSSESVTGVAAAIEAGMAVGVLGASALGPELAALSEAEGFGPMPASMLVLQYGKTADGELCRAMGRAIERAFPRPLPRPFPRSLG